MLRIKIKRTLEREKVGYSVEYWWHWYESEFREYCETQEQVIALVTKLLDIKIEVI